MGFLTKSLLILAIAAGTPLLYRQFADDNTIKFMSNYYSNYQAIDRFLRQSADRLDNARDYLPDSEQIKGAVGDLNQRFKSFVDSTIASNKQQSSSSSSNKKQQAATTTKLDAAAKPAEKAVKFSTVSCPDEPNVQEKSIRLWSKDELAKFDGNSPQQTDDIYLAFLGLVYNVTVNGQHYAKGAEYNIFTGRDATRAFVTGNFTHDLIDDVRGIDESMFSHIESWRSFYSTSYPILGRLVGIFYDSRGCATAELKRVHQVFEKLEQTKQDQRQSEKEYPECNSEWNSDTKSGRVWCSDKSGGVERDWAGLPRIYNDGQSNRCACFNPQGKQAKELEQYMSLYPGCDPKATECELRDSSFS